MTGELIGAAIFVFGVIFAAGKFVNSVTEGTKKEMAQTKIDVNRIGAKVRELEKVVARHNHNTCQVLQAIQENKDDRFKTAGLVKED